MQKEALMATFRYLIAAALIILVLRSTFPLLMSAYYGGNPPPHIAHMLDRQSESF